MYITYSYCNYLILKRKYKLCVFTFFKLNFIKKSVKMFKKKEEVAVQV